jgi:hypothetical protein
MPLIAESQYREEYLPSCPNKHARPHRTQVIPTITSPRSRQTRTDIAFLPAPATHACSDEVCNCSSFCIIFFSIYDCSPVLFTGCIIMTAVSCNARRSFGRICITPIDCQEVTPDVRGKKEDDEICIWQSRR